MTEYEGNWNLTISPGDTDDSFITISDIYRGYSSPGTIHLDPMVLSRAAASRAVLEKSIGQEEHIYGVTTGFGDEGGRDIPHELRIPLQEQVVEYHGAGFGNLLSPGESRVVFLCRIISLAQGYSGVRPELLSYLVRLFNLDILPAIPSRGSVGASGDLTPLSYLAAMIQGKRKVWHKSELMDASTVLSEFKIAPWQLGLKEGLAMINGTAVLTALAAVSVAQARNIAVWIDRITAMGALALGSQGEPYESWIHERKHHPGSIASADEIQKAAVLDDEPISRKERRGNIQPRYSMRCAPQVSGVLRDTAEMAAVWVEREINSANDNPLFDPEKERVYHSGNFYGGHVSAACDYLRIALSTSSQLIDRQVQLLLEGSGRLEKNLADSTNELDFGMKALGISTTALSAEIQHYASPVSVLTRPTESGNQDVVSMGSVSALKLREQIEYVFMMLGHGCAVARKAVNISQESGNLSQKLSDTIHAMEESMDGTVHLDAMIEKITEYIKRRS